MRLKLTLSLLFLSLWVRPCGWSPDDDSYSYYNVFAQTVIDDIALYPFLNDGYNTFFSDENEEFQKPYYGSFLLWQQILPDWSIDELERVLNSATNEDFHHFWKTKGKDKKGAALEYMETARSCADTFAYRSSRSWDYDEILQNREVDVAPLLQKAINGFEKVDNDQLKLRYAYQILRIFHYSKQYDEAISFYNQKVKGKFEPNEIYYYCMDQVAGCYYSKEYYGESAYLFLQVFDKSIDRKVSAALSYRFCDINGADAADILKTGEDSIAWYSLNAWRGYDSFEAFKRACSIDPTSPKTELLFMRTLNQFEHQRWPTGAGIEGIPRNQTNEGIMGRIPQLAQIADSLQSVPELTNKEFWLITASYLNFMDGNLVDAKLKLNDVKSERFAKQKETLSKVYEVFVWKSINREEEVFIENNLSDLFKLSLYQYWGDNKPGWNYLMLDQIAHLYYKSGKLAEAYLCHNNLSGVELLSSQLLVDDLKSFLEKKNKTTLESMLAARGGLNAQEALSFIYEAKGLYYLQEANSKEAYLWLKKSKELSTGAALANSNSKISARIFSNNTIECFHCDESVMMVDSVYLAEAFSFIQPYFDKAGLAENLIKLDSMTQLATQWKVKLANYLLANYYFNVSNTGYFRGTLTNTGNCCDYNYVQKSAVSVSEKMEKLEGYNLSDIKSYEVTYYALADESYDHFQKVIENSTDPELNARCLYMMAKCELNAMYNEANTSYGYSYDGVKVNDRYHYSFETLKTKYSETEFYRQTIKECSFFKYYVSL